MQLSFLSERVNAIRASWASRRPGSLRAKKKEKTKRKREAWQAQVGAETRRRAC